MRVPIVFTNPDGTTTPSYLSLSDSDPLGTDPFLRAIRSSYELRHAERYPQQDADDERYAERIHGPIYDGGSDDERAE